MTEKTLDVTSLEDTKTKVNDVQVVGNVDMFQLLCKASSKSQGWMKSAKACEVEGLGCIVQVTTQHNEHVAEALTFVPHCTIENDVNGGRKLVSNPVQHLAAEICSFEPDTKYEDLVDKYSNLVNKYSALADKYVGLMLNN